ncbi:hypothetical protein ACE83Q_00965 [Dellaglioa sp. P0083]|uniref:hypothetical protein n=1 Tax=Dellaglioa kimchii TaxID=3344667 RepID=UPI0038D37E08
MSLILQSLSSIFYHKKQTVGLFIIFFFTILIGLSNLLFNQISFESFKSFKKMLAHINVNSTSSSNLVSILTDIHKQQVSLIYPIIIGLLIAGITISIVIYKKIINKRTNEYLSLHNIGESQPKVAFAFALEVFTIFIAALILVMILIFFFKNSYTSLLRELNIYWINHSLAIQLSPSEISSELLELLSHKLTNFNGDFLISSTNVQFSTLISQESFINSAYLFAGGITISLISFLSVLFSTRNSSH